MLNNEADRRLAAAILLLMLGACGDTGPTTSARIEQDIRTGYWLQNQIPPAQPGALPFSSFNDITTVGP